MRGSPFLPTCVMLSYCLFCFVPHIHNRERERKRVRAVFKRQTVLSQRERLGIRFILPRSMFLLYLRTHFYESFLFSWPYFVFMFTAMFS